jgi:hypothetical protein
MASELTSVTVHGGNAEDWGFALGVAKMMGWENKLESAP